MKKFLALVLALVMTMSLVTISAGAEDFTDAADVTYTEAVDVMTAVGVVGGYADGSFNPTAGLTRGAAAKIICNMILGPTTAGALSANDAPYSDVPADHTFAGYIAYCANEGIISGYADGTFRPAAPLTGYAFMKMLLGALGYDADIEGYTGANWSIQVAKRALNIGLDSGLEGDFVGNKALTREEAALYAFNTMKADMVNYGNKSSIQVGDITITTSADANTIPSDITKVADNGKLQFAEKYFTKLSLKAADADDFKRPAHTWRYDKDTVGTYTDEPVLVYTDEFKVSDLKDDLYDLDVEILDAAPTGEGAPTYSLDVYTNGKGETVSFQTVANMANSTKLGGAGIAVELYDKNDDDVVETVVVVTTYVAKVTKVVADKASTKADESALELEVVNNGKDIVANEDKTAGFVDVYGEVEKGDYVLVTPENDMSGTCEYALTVAVPETVEGIVTKTATATKVSIDGEVYTIAKLADKVSALTANSKAERTLILDEYGNAIYTPDAVADSADLVYVTDVFEATDKYGDKTYYAQVVHVDGEIEEIEVLAAMYGTNGANAATYENKVCSFGYANSNDDAYTLTVNTADVVAMAGKAIKTSDAKVDGTSNYYSDDVVFVYVNKSGAKLTATAVEGVQKSNNVPANSYAVLTNDTAKDVICVFVRSAASAAVDADNLVFIADAVADGTALDNDGKRQDTYKFYINGEEYVEIAELDAAKTGFMKYSVEGVTYKFEAVDFADGAFNYTSIATIGKDKYVSVNTGDADTSVVDATLSGDIYDLSENDIDELADIAELQTAGKRVAIAFMYDSDDNVISNLYVISVA